MSIVQTKKYLLSLEKLSNELSHQYAHQPLVKTELKKLNQSLDDFRNYLTQLDDLKPQYHTESVQDFMRAIQLHIDILKVELEKKDFAKLNRQLSIIKTMLKFHPTKYSFFAYAYAWIMDFLYFF